MNRNNVPERFINPASYQLPWGYYWQPASFKTASQISELIEMWLTVKPSHIVITRETKELAYEYTAAWWHETEFHAVFCEV